MVVGLCELVEDADFALGLQRRLHHSHTECLFVYRLRARECKQDAARRNAFHSRTVDARVALDSLIGDVGVLGEGGRVEDDEVVFVGLHLVEIFKCICRDCLVVEVKTI